ncbi:MAG TPA: DUF1232 domain-containing protein [Chloroflexia bacterium]|nr:DUF1232 domain-containing protein [Chloroflexia bacterium]
MAQQNNAITEVLERGKLVLRLMQDERVPTWLKVGVPLLVALYFLSPVDLIPDFILGLGQLDDIGVILLGMALFIRLAPQFVVDEHRHRLGQTTGGPSTGTPTHRMPPSTDQTIEGDFEVRRPE